MTPQILSAIALLFSTVALFLAYNAAKNAMASAEYCALQNKRSKMVRLEAELTDMTDSIQGIRESMHKLRSRIGMREYRDRQKEPEKPAHDPNSPEGRDAERAELEKELQDKGMLHSRVHQIGVKSGN